MSGLLCIINANQRIISALLAFVLIYVMFRLVYLLLFIVMHLSGCNADTPVAPFCRTKHTATMNQHAPQLKNAGCLIRFDQRILLVTHRLTGKLDIPGGMQRTDESLACTAHRETFEETGLNVEVLLPVAQTTNGMLVFSCLADNMLNITHFPRPAPDFALVETTTLDLYNLYELDDNHLRFADDLIRLRDGYVLTPVSSPLQPR